MRTWYVELEILDDNRLVAQHRELHTVFGSLMSPTRGYQNHPVTKLYAGEHMACAIDYHAYTLRQMSWRGWTGHTTPTSEAVASVAATRSGPATCKDWQDHVKHHVPLYGQYSIHGDLHDLIERWTKEMKGLRNDLAAKRVGEHRQHCDDFTCRNNATRLLTSYRDRLPGDWVQGNSSLRNTPVGANP